MVLAMATLEKQTTCALCKYTFIVNIVNASFTFKRRRRPQIAGVSSLSSLFNQSIHLVYLVHNHNNLVLQPLIYMSDCTLRTVSARRD